jgi:hypothetical protein
VGIATVGSVLGTAGLGLIAFVPFVGLAVVPLQVAGWLVRGFVFQYIALTSLSAYLTCYRYDRRGSLQPSVGAADEDGGFPREAVAGRRTAAAGR